MTINIRVLDHDEAPVLEDLDDDTIYLRNGSSSELYLVHDWFSDPEGKPVQWDENHIYICDNETTTRGRTATIGESVEYRADSDQVNHDPSNTRHCSALSQTIDETDAANAGGRRVISGVLRGPTLAVVANKLPETGPRGTYKAIVYARAFDGKPRMLGADAVPESASGETANASTDFAKLTVLVRVGVNNLPQPRGNAVGFAATEDEDTRYISPANAGDWNALDLDTRDPDYVDQVMYTVSHVRRKDGTLLAGKACSPVVRSGAARNLSLFCPKLDFEDSSEYVVVVRATDNWDTVEYPIKITLRNVNELVWNSTSVQGSILGNDFPEIRLVSTDAAFGLNLNRYITDPEDDPVSYQAYTNIGTDVVDVVGPVLRIDPARAGTSVNDPMKELTITLIAMDAPVDQSTKKARTPITATASLKLRVRHSNDEPRFDEGTVSIGMSVNEHPEADTVLLPGIRFYDSDYIRKEFVARLDSALFDTVVNPMLDKHNKLCSSVGGDDECKSTAPSAEDANVLYIVTNRASAADGDVINYEVAAQHDLELILDDGWAKSRPLRIQVNVIDVNDSPSISRDGNGDVRKVDKQEVSAHGHLRMSVGEYFVDEDGDRLVIHASSDNEEVATAEVSGLDRLTLRGISVGDAMIELTADDRRGGKVSQSFAVTVLANAAPVPNDDAFASRLPADNTINVGSFADIELEGLFYELDRGDEITSITAVTGDESLLLVALTGEDDGIATLVGRAPGDATLTITAMDKAGNATSIEHVITVNAPPEEAMPLDPQILDRVTPHVVDVSGVFTDSDDGDDSLTITAEAVGDGMERVTVEVMGTELTITGVIDMEPGDVEIVLTAIDPHGATGKSTFVATTVNLEPTVVKSVEAQEIDRIKPHAIDVGGVFADVDGEIGVITASVSDDAVIEVGAIDLEDGMLTVTALAVGETVVTLTATDVNGASIMDAFKVTEINIEPVVAHAIPDQATTRVIDLSLDVGMTFDDPDQDNSLLTISVSVADRTLVDASLAGSTLTISGLDVGATVVTLTAMDADGGKVETTFTTTIENIAPLVANSINPIELEVGGQPATQAIAGLFSDDGDSLSYAIASANVGVASALINDMTAVIGPVSRGTTSFTITAIDPHGGEASVTGLVTVSDDELKTVAAKSLASVGRALLASVSSSVGSRVMTDARSSDLALDAWAPVDGNAMAVNTSANDRSDTAWNAFNTANTATAARTTSTDAFGSEMSGLDALRSTIGRSFALNLGSSENPSNWSVWGEIDRQSYEGEGYDGMASSVYLGADVSVAECWIFGVAVSSSSGESDYSWGTATQTMELSLMTVLPYISYQPTNGSSIWGVAGFGSGELDTTVVGASNDVSDLSSTITMVGGSQELTTVGRLSLALRGDAATASLETEDGNGAAEGLAADVNRVRMGLEGSFRTETGQGGMLEPFGQVSLRSDSGDGDTGAGIEVAGGVRMTSGTFTFEVQGRTLAMHGADEYSESGFSLMAKLNPSASETGVSVSIAPRWGADALSNGTLWQDDLNLGSANTYGVLTGFGQTGASRSIDAQLGYGMRVANEQFLLTPFLDLGINDGDRREILLGISLQHLVRASGSLDVNLALGRVEERTSGDSGKNGLIANLRF